ncbi:hypothetical protein, partial [Staphylococcus pseudintermedius]
GLISFIIMMSGNREPAKYHFPKERIQNIKKRIEIEKILCLNPFID